MSDRSLLITIFAPTRRLLRRGLWRRWSIELVNEYDGMSWHLPVASGWVKGAAGATYAQFSISDETELSRRMLAVAYGMTA